MSNKERVVAYLNQVRLKYKRRMWVGADQIQLALGLSGCAEDLCDRLAAKGELETDGKGRFRTPSRALKNYAIK